MWQGWVEIYTNLAADPIVSGKNRRFGILYRSHEFFKCGGEGRVLFWSVEDGSALKQRISRFHKQEIWSQLPKYRRPVYVS